jgi:hypothetical protein
LGVQLTLLGAVLPLAAQTVTFTVTTTADAGPGTLRQALIDGNGLPGPVQVRANLPAGSIITLASDLPLLVPAYDFDFLAIGGLTIDGNGHRILASAPAVPRTFVRLRSLVLRNGRNDVGGCLHALAEQISVTTVELHGCRAEATAAAGGGAFLAGTAVAPALQVQVADSRFIGNRAVGQDARGGALAIERVSSIVGIGTSVFLDNRAEATAAAGNARGGALDLAVWSSLAQVTLIDNQALALDPAHSQGGAIFAAPLQSSHELQVDQALATGNRAGSGSAIAVRDGRLRLVNLTVAGNTGAVAGTGAALWQHSTVVQPTAVRLDALSFWRNVAPAGAAADLALTVSGAPSGPAPLSVAHSLFGSRAPACSLGGTWLPEPTAAHNRWLGAGADPGCPGIVGVGVGDESQLRLRGVRWPTTPLGFVPALVPYAGSVLIDAGAALSGATPDRCPIRDAQFQARPADGDGNGTSQCDIGAFEAQGEAQAPLFADDFDVMLCCSPP